MAGVTDRVFRQLCRELGAQLTYSEMVSAKGLAYANKKTSHLLVCAPAEDKIVVQLFGHEPDIMAAQAYEIQEQMGNRLFAIDINMGCPAKKISSKGDGSALMRNPKLAGHIVQAVSHAVSVPVTVKIRRGYEMNNETAPELARIAEQAGAAAVTVHGRFAAQLYKGAACWDTIARVKQAVSIPVVGNGDVTSADAALAMRTQTGCDAVMVGRAARVNPWVFRDIAAAFEDKPLPAPPTIDERMDLACRHARMLAEIEGSQNLVSLRKQSMNYVAGMADASALRRSLSSAVTLQNFLDIFEQARINTKAQREDYHV